MPPHDHLPDHDCDACTDGHLDFDFSMAFQPVVHMATGEIFAQEALVRGPRGEPAAEVLAHINLGNRYRFDQACRVKAIELAARLGIDTRVSINFMANAVHRPDRCIRTSLEAAERLGIAPEEIIFEFNENEPLEDPAQLREIIALYQKLGFRIAIDDFAIGASGLNLVADIQPDFVKIHMGLVRDLHLDFRRQAILRGIVQTCDELAITVVAKGVETLEEFRKLQAFGIDLYQGYFFGRPGFETLPAVAPEVPLPG